MSTPAPTAPAEPRSSQAQTGRPAWPVVARREIIAHLTDRNFIIGTLMTLVLFGLSFGAQAVMGNRSHHYDVAVTTPAAAALVRQADQDPQVRERRISLSAKQIQDEAAAKQQVRDESVDALLQRQNGQWVLTGNRSVNDSLQNAVAGVVAKTTTAELARRAGTTSQAAQHASAVPFELLDGNAKDAQVASFASFVFSLLFYMASLMFGISIAQSVVQEKQSRIVEIIASAIPVNQLLLGKVLGMIALALIQMLLYVGVGLTGVAFTEYRRLMPTLADGSLWFIVFFVAGFAALASLWAVTGALASRTEDVNQTSMPLTVTLIMAFLVVARLDDAGLRIASFIPIASSIAMPKRVLQGGVPLWEPVVALLITVAAALAIVRFAAVVYQRALMQTGGRLTIRQALNAER